MWSSTNRQKSGHLLTDKSEVICTQIKSGNILTNKMWSSSHRQKCDHMFSYRNVIICSKAKVWFFAHRQKCGNLFSVKADKSVVNCSQTK